MNIQAMKFFTGDGPKLFIPYQSVILIDGRVTEGVRPTADCKALELLRTSETSPRDAEDREREQKTHRRGGKRKMCL